ncbi:SDR family NAD(P)-dependent oxidoreductase [Kribbella solani]|uniref:SDR family NAD(P)-dependent oxidoreductase n=1 Tax=Kribbella solani TaxID=236067 RepID=UPI0029AF1681|nr:SDR family oxidoreductase [Kribbella solani]MDX2968088.1 SDR family NAD(P)-dependent oxidoreductase [Kribbella solani]MDX3005381.1 SDR family NAD(P)-dependent oxidoreductase [Kribbella solani]
MRTIVVTGGATGIGRATAEQFRADGDEVVITGRRADVLAKAAAELGVRGVVCDATDPAQIEQLLAELPERIDVLVNNAGGNTDFSRASGERMRQPTGAPAQRQGGELPNHAGGELAQLKSSWLANLEANLISAVLTTTALAPRLTTAVVHLGSIAGARGAGSYGASKAALALWNAEVAAELGPRGITSNVVAPGFTADTEFFQGQLTDERRETLLQATLTKREGEVADIAATIHFLASPAARHLTGQVLHVNGGALTTR